MTLDEFEETFTEYANTPSEIGSNLKEKFEYARSVEHISKTGGEYMNSVRRYISLLLKDVEPAEDRDFLTLKYSEYLK